MKSNKTILRASIESDGPYKRTVYTVINLCTVCQDEYISPKPSASLYCPRCAARIAAEKNRARVRKYRERQKAEKGNQ